MTWIALSAPTACGLYAQQAQTNAPITLPALHETWHRHLRTITSPKQQEWKIRQQLRIDPTHVTALDELITLLNNNQEATLHAAAMQYAARTGHTNFTTNLIYFHDEVQEVINRDATQEETDEAFTLTRLDIARDRLKKTERVAISLADYAKIEAELRDLLRRSKLQKEILILLSDYYHHRSDWPMTTMTTMLVLRIEPENPRMLQRCYELLEAPAYANMQRLMVAFYARRNDLNKDIIGPFIELAQTLRMEDAVLSFRVQAAKLFPEKPEHWQEIGKIMLVKREYEKAQKALEHAKSLPEHDPIIYNQLARLYHHTGDERNMTYWLQRWREHVSDDAVAEALLSKPFNQYPQLLGKLD